MMSITTIASTCQACGYSNKEGDLSKRIVYGISLDFEKRGTEYDIKLCENCLREIGDLIHDTFSI